MEDKVILTDLSNEIKDINEQDNKNKNDTIPSNYNKEKIIIPEWNLDPPFDYVDRKEL